MLYARLASGSGVGVINVRLPVDKCHEGGKTKHFVWRMNIFSFYSFRIEFSLKFNIGLKSLKI